MENKESEKHEEKPQTHEKHHEEKPMTKKARSNPWVVSTVVLAIFALILIITSLIGGGITGNAVSENEAGQIIIDFAQEQTGEEIGLVEVNEASGLYEVVILYQDQELPLYLTKDGENLVQGLTPLAALSAPTEDTTTTQTDVPKSDMPVVELFVMTHCPYGTQAEKGFIPTIKALGDKINAKIRFVHYFMHEPEETETPRQVCIREEQPDKYLDYLECFLEDGDSSRCIAEVGIDEDSLQTCVDEKSTDYYEVDSALSEGYGVRGSPTLVINGVVASSGRSSAAFLETICGAFNTAPEECSTLTLSDASPSPGFGYEATGTDTQAQC
jgi:protein-disulfide isomerase